MPSYWEKSSRTAYPIEFKPLDDLRDEEKFHLHSYPSLERPRQLLLDPTDPNEFRTISRDYCLISSPGFTSWQRQEAQKSPVVEIFYTDTIKVPKADPKKAYRSRPRDAFNITLAYWYLRDITRGNVDRILKKHFGLNIPLSYESTSNHWVPIPLLYNVEVRENVWEDRLALFFDGNIGTSVLPLSKRVNEYRHLLKTNVLGEKYLNIWRSRWPGATKLAVLNGGKSSLTSIPALSQELAKELDKETSLPKPRGRKRRAVLRQQRTGADYLVRLI